MDPVPDPLLLRKSGSAGDRTRDLCICSQKLWPLDHRGGLNVSQQHKISNISWKLSLRKLNEAVTTFKEMYCSYLAYWIQVIDSCIKWKNVTASILVRSDWTMQAKKRLTSEWERDAWIILIAPLNSYHHKHWWSSLCMPQRTKAVNWQEIPVNPVSRPKQVTCNREVYRLNVLKQHAIFRSRREGVIWFMNVHYVLIITCTCM